LAPTDYSSFNCDLSKPQSQFNAYYKYSEKYALSGSLGSSLEQLNPKLVTSSALQALYRGYYYSGNNAACPINDTNWPVYWGGIGKMWAQDLTNAVNSYR
jgi:sphingomyelin phosphodiesterase acid-like 3